MRLLYFKAPWCSACKAITPPEEAQIIDCEENEDVAESYDIRQVPCFVIINDLNVEVQRLYTSDVRKVIHEYENYK